MDIKELLKPTILKVLIFLFISFIYLYFAGESTCAIGFAFSICYQAQGFPFQYLITGDIDSAYDIIKTLPLGDYFNKFGNLLLNPIALALNIVLIYLLSSLLSMIFVHKKLKSKNTKK